MGTTGLVAQAYGAEDADEVRAILARAWLLAAGLAAVILVLQKPIGMLAFAVLDSSPEVRDLASRYYAIRVWGAPAALMNYVALGWLFGMQRMRAALALSVFMNGVNIVLDLLLVIGLGWGIAGVAWATFISEWSALGLGFWLIARGLRSFGGTWHLPRIRDGARLGALLKVNADIFVRTLCLVSAFAWFTAQGARLGDVLLAANAVLLNFQTFMAYGLDGFAHASEALIGGAIGARDPAALRSSVRVASLWALIVAALFCLVYFAAGPLIIFAITDIREVRATALEFLPWAAISPIISVWSFQLDGIFIGATRTAEMRNGMLISLGFFLLAVSTLIPRLDNHGLWLALMLFMVVRAVTLGAWYPRVVRAIERG
jgi:MATE family multidrug resistance protein